MEEEEGGIGRGWEERKQGERKGGGGVTKGEGDSGRRGRSGGCTHIS